MRGREHNLPSATVTWRRCRFQSPPPTRDRGSRANQRPSQLEIPLGHHGVVTRPVGFPARLVAGSPRPKGHEILPFVGAYRHCEGPRPGGLVPRPVSYPLHRISLSSTDVPLRAPACRGASARQPQSILRGLKGIHPKSNVCPRLVPASPPPRRTPKLPMTGDSALAGARYRLGMGDLRYV